MDVDSAASKTALMVCAYRARASKWPQQLFEDPWAEAIAGPEGHAIAARLDAVFPPMELWLGLRVAYLDRMIARSVDALGVRQVVILGAGYDTRAARLPRAGVRFFEVDHPATQAQKRERVGRLPGYPVDAATYVACNFEREDPIECLVANGLAASEPTLVIWEGVVPYLTEGAVRATAARLAAGLDPRSLVAFDFVGKKFAAGQDLSDKDRETRAYVGDLGEPIRYGTDDILPLLYDSGFRWVRSLDFNELALELLGDYRRDRQFRFQHIALAAARTPSAGWP
ncbi:MAG: class I SAM-dependent methyltransferase [Deltaproteobacteria bacterium]|nr:class I SAM-dependent methyltransferase [Deltaproteobacteria bacterium]MCW5802837.1 class I SAM-dependent methyltransferase [Deltaproteobacteria bacterium]